MDTVKKIKCSHCGVSVYSVRDLVEHARYCTGNKEQTLQMKEITVKPLLDRIIIKQSEGRKEVAGMIIPESERQKPLRGVVVAAGPGFRNSKGEIVPMTVKVGDEVAYMEHSAIKIEIDEKDYIFLKEGDLILIY